MKIRKSPGFLLLAGLFIFSISLYVQDEPIVQNKEKSKKNSSHIVNKLDSKTKKNTPKTVESIPKEIPREENQKESETRFWITIIVTLLVGLIGGEGIREIIKYIKGKTKRLHTAKTAEDIYRAALKEELDHIDLLGSPDIESKVVKLEDAFVSLCISESWRSEERFRPGNSMENFERERYLTPEQVMKRAFQKHRLLLVAGDPGSGKTTLLKYYAVNCLDKKYRQLGFQEDVFPVYFPLRELNFEKNEPVPLPRDLAKWADNFINLDIKTEEKEIPIPEPGQWFEWMKEDHLFVSAGPNEYVFIHSTMMEYLAAIVLSEDRDYLKEWEEIYKNIPRLTRPYFLEKYLDYKEFSRGDSEIVSLREQLLKQVINGELADHWLGEHGKEKEPAGLDPEEQSLLTFDADTYHPEDRNFNYYRQYSRKEIMGILVSPNMKHSDVVSCVAFSPDGRYMVSGSWDSTLKLWDVSGGKEIRTFKGHSGDVNSVCFAPDGLPLTLVSASNDHTLKTWDIKTGACLKTIPLLWRPREIKPFPGRPGLFASANFNGTVTLFDLSEIINRR